MTQPLSSKWQPISTCPEGIEIEVLMEKDGKFTTARLTKVTDKFYFFAPKGVNGGSEMSYTEIRFGATMITHWQPCPEIFEPEDIEPVPGPNNTLEDMLAYLGR